MSGNVMTFF